MSKAKPYTPTCHWLHSYSGPTAAFAYMNLDAAHVRRIFILGPSHHVYLKCASSPPYFIFHPYMYVCDPGLNRALALQYHISHQGLRRLGRLGVRDACGGLEGTSS